VVSGACFTGLVLYILFALSYYALIKAILSLGYLKVKLRLKLLGARIEALEFPRVIFLRIDPFWAPESIDSGKSVDPESKL
jgi:hypothetical protein